MFKLLKNKKKYLKVNNIMDDDINRYLNVDYKVMPHKEATRIAAIYGVVGLTWILWSDDFLSRIVNDVITYRKFAIYKGWAYVAVTMMLIYFLVLKRVSLFEKAVKKIYSNYEDLNSANEELMALEEELRQQFKEVECHKNELDTLAHYDKLTELPNRLSFEARVNELIAENSKNSRKFAMLYMDIDNFKHINDTLGHSLGDVLLRYISNILKHQVKAPDFVARIGGDEFVIIFNNIENQNEVSAKVQNLIKYLRRPWILNKQEFFVSYSIGIAMYPEHGESFSMLLKNADLAMYFVKKNLKDNYAFYFEKMEENNSQKVKMINDLRVAIDNGEFMLFYQPIVDLNSGELSGVEALIRWFHPVKGMVSPMEFIPLAEETGLINNIDKWVFKTALLQKKSWEEQGYAPIKMSVNISGKRVTKSGFVEEVKELISNTGLKCAEIQLEVTETAVMEDVEASTKILEDLSDFGVKIALDDFGKGYSSLTYLQKLPIDIVKLDREFIISILDMAQNDVLVETIIKLTHDLKLKIVSEGIETKEQLEFLKASRSDYGQGYLFSKPVRSEEIEKMLKKI